MELSKDLLKWIDELNRECNEFYDATDDSSATIIVFHPDVPEGHYGRWEPTENCVGLNNGCVYLKINLLENVTTSWHETYTDDGWNEPSDHVGAFYKTGWEYHHCPGLNELDEQTQKLYFALLLYFSPDIMISHIREDDHYLCEKSKELDILLWGYLKPYLEACLNSGCSESEFSRDCLSWLR